MKEYELSLHEINSKRLKTGYEKLTFGMGVKLTDENFSYFDFLLMSEWRKAMRNGVFKFQLDSPLPTRHLDGKYGFIAQVKHNLLI